MGAEDEVREVELRKLAEAATPGPWEVVGGWVEATHGGEVTPQRVDCMSYCYGGTPERMESGDAKYIAAASPDVVIGLLDALASARTENDRLAAQVADAWDEGYRSGNVDGYFETREEMNPYLALSTDSKDDD